MAMLEEDSRIQSDDTVPEISYQNQIVSNLTWKTKAIEEVQSLNFLLMAGYSEEQTLSPRQPPSHQLLKRDQVRWTQNAWPWVWPGPAETQSPHHSESQGSHVKCSF